MATSPMSEVVRRLHQAMLRQGGSTLTDGELLEAFLVRRDGGALGALMRRLGPMVWGVCRRVLDNYHDAEDAFQATFLVLVRRAASVVPREMVASWLHGVAYLTARKVRANGARRRAREKQVAEMPEPQALAQAVAHEHWPLLDQELNHLPDKYRAAIVLCDLQGRTRHEAARQLGVPEGTLSGRLTRGRAILARRLVRRGLGVASVAAALSESCIAAEVPVALMSRTVRAATLLAAGEAASAIAVSSQVHFLVKGVVRAMFLNRIKFAAATVLALLVLGAGVILLTPGARAAAQLGATATEQTDNPKGDASKPAAAPGLLLKEVELDAVNEKAHTVSASIGGKLVLKGKGELVTDKGDGTPAKIKFVFGDIQLSNKRPKLVDVPVAKDAKITNGDKALKLEDIKAGMHGSLELGVRDGQLVIIAIAIKE